MITKLVLNEREIWNGGIRRATAEDIPNLIDVDCNCDSVVIKRLNASKEQIEYTVMLRFNDKSKEFYVYELTDNYEENKIVGYATLNIDEDNDYVAEKRYNCELSWIAVKKEFQGRGVGRRLAEFIENIARGRGFESICAKTSENGNDRVYRFYLMLGYRKIKVTDEFYSDGTRAVLFGKQLVD